MYFLSPLSGLPVDKMSSRYPQMTRPPHSMNACFTLAFTSGSAMTPSAGPRNNLPSQPITRRPVTDVTLLPS